MDDAREKMSEFVADTGSYRAAGERLGMSAQCCLDVASGKRPAGPKARRALSLPPPAVTCAERRRWAMKERILIKLGELTKKYKKPIGTGLISVACGILDETACSLLWDLQREGRIVRIGNRWEMVESDGGHS